EAFDLMPDSAQSLEHEELRVDPKQHAPIGDSSRQARGQQHDRRIERHRQEQKQREQHRADPLPHRRRPHHLASSASAALERSGCVSTPSSASRERSVSSRGVPTKIGRAPTASAASTSASLSPTNGTPSSGWPKSASIRRKRPGFGL